MVTLREGGARSLEMLIVVTLGFCACQQVIGKEVQNERKVKGQQYVTQTVVAKVVGPNGFSQEFLDMLKDGNTRIVIDNTTLLGGANGTTSALITENVKTTVTRVTIPLSTSFMDSDWYRETLRKFLQKNRLALTNNTIEDYAEDGKVDIDLIVLKLWAGATLRDNLISVFGNLLYRREPVLPADLHSALTYLYEMARLRRFSTTGFLDVLEKMSFETPHEQFKSLFLRLERHVPKHLRSCVTYWLENLYGNTLNLTELLSDQNGVLVADFLSGIDSSAILPLQEKVLFPKQTTIHSSSENEELLGKMLSRVLTGVVEGSIPLTRQLFAGILLHLPLDKLTPQADEYLRFFADSVKNGNATDDRLFQNAVNSLSFNVDHPNPYQFTRKVFRSLMAANAGDSALYETILTNTRPVTKTYSLRNYDTLAPIIDSNRINMQALMSGVVSEEYPADIVDAKDRLLYYLDKNYIDFDFALRGFTKHQQTTPTDLLIAVLSRIQVRSKNPFPELSKTLTSLRTHIMYKQKLTSLRPSLSVGDLSTMLLSFQSPSLPARTREVAADLRTLLLSEFLDIEQELNQQATERCVRPRQCVTNILQYLITTGMIRNKECKTKAMEFLRMVSSQGEGVPIAQRSFPERSNCVCVSRSHANRMLGVVENEKDREGGDTDKIYPGKFNPSPYKNHNFDRKAYERPMFVSRLASGKVMVTGENGEVFFTSKRPELVGVNFTRVPIPHPGWANHGSTAKGLLPSMTPEQEKYMAPIVALLLKENLPEVVGVTPSSYATKGQLLEDILLKSLQIGTVFDSEDQRNFTESYLKLLHYAYSVLPPPPPANSGQFKREVNLSTLLQAVPLPEDPNAEKKFDLLKSLLTGSSLSWVKQQIDANVYPSKGSYLKQLLHILLRDGILKDKATVEALRYFEMRVITAGYGAQPVDWVIVMEDVSDSP